MKRAAFQHSKLRRLMRCLDIPLYAAVGILETLWNLCARESPQGNIGKLSNEDIADALGWKDSAQLISALLECGWLEKSHAHRLIVHDWHDHADDAVKKWLQRSKLVFVSGNVETCIAVVETVPDKNRLPEPEPCLALPEPKPKASPPKAAPSSFSAPTWVSSATWNEFELMRRKIRKPMTDRARENIIAKLDRFRGRGQDIEEVLNRSITNGWQDVWEIEGRVANGKSGRNEQALADFNAELDAANRASA